MVACGEQPSSFRSVLVLVGAVLPAAAAAGPREAFLQLELIFPFNLALLLLPVRVPISALCKPLHPEQAPPILLPPRQFNLGVTVRTSQVQKPLPAH